MPILNEAARALRETVYRLVPVALGAIVITFLILHLVPGDPAAMILGDNAHEDAVFQLQERLGLNKPLVDQMADFLGRVVLHADTGQSLVYGVSTRDLIVARLPVTLALVAVSTIFTIGLVVLLAVTAAASEGRVADHLVRAFVTAGAALPVFWVAIVLTLIFSVNLKWLPVGGIATGEFGLLRSLVLPGFAAAISAAPVLVRSLRAQLLEIMESDFVVSARISGIRERRILFRHILPNSVLPALLLLGMNIGGMIGGSLVLERVFALPGVGSLLFQAIGMRDYPLVQAIVLYSAIAVVIVSFVTDLVVQAIDPRLRRPAQ